MKRKLSIFILLALLLTVLVLPAQATELGYVTDAAGLLTDAEWTKLETMCGSISEQYNCGVYIITVEDFADYGDGDVYEVTYGIYHGYELGMGAERNGLVLLLSMDTREFALFVYGDEAEYAFDEYGQEMLESEFLPYFGEDDWCGGFEAYVRTCGSYLAGAAAGEPVREGKGTTILLAVLASFAVSLIVVLILRAGMKNVEKQVFAGQYQSGELKLTREHDQFTHKTQTRTKIETDSDNDSKARSGGGGSGRSGKF